MDQRFFSVLICFAVLFVPYSQCQVTDLPTTVSPIVNTTALTPDQLCRTKSTCDECVAVEGAKCYFCHNNQTNNYGCRLYPASKVFPTDDCPLSEARWGVCWVNFEALIIAMSVIAGVLLIAIVTTCYCCCCRNKRSSVVDRTTLKWERETREREQRHADRRAEREAKMDAIRQKYGLNRETSSYNRMA
ncbi:pituitary tumor-transforming gene 1 protein-interacting protein-like [Paramacrobiotus metropolitanus]|uniref:pituitary tumor-transforming gene 1 protein-interacting protein-like n=1 Tax=Paramacrobiotus metropolitanus TaxID=2943436 RepID=UPI0024460376|nr:pituitary tumor-transforming gene 1 protein-interacting protein-like [Paramacrobiotus metropolitanus]